MPDNPRDAGTLSPLTAEERARLHSWVDAARVDAFLAQLPNAPGLRAALCEYLLLVPRVHVRDVPPLAPGQVAFIPPQPGGIWFNDPVLQAEWAAITRGPT